MKSSIIHGARLNHPTNIYINEYLTQKHSALLYKLRVKKDNPAIGSIVLHSTVYKCTPEMFNLLQLHSDKNKQYLVNEELDLDLIKSENNDASQKVTSSKKTTEQLTTSSKR